MIFFFINDILLLLIIHLVHKKSMEYHELLVLCITGWIEYEPSNAFSTPTDNLNHTWFGTHIFRHDTRLLIFWNK